MLARLSRVGVALFALTCRRHRSIGRAPARLASRAIRQSHAQRSTPASTRRAVAIQRAWIYRRRQAVARARVLPDTVAILMSLAALKSTGA